MVMGELERQCDVLVIGGGPGGYVCALRAAQLGKDVVLIDKEKLGGVCLNHGCVPSKALIQVAKLFHEIKELDRLGLHIEGARVDMPRLQAWKNRVEEQLRNGIAGLCARYGVEVIHATAFFESSSRASYRSEEGGGAIKFKKAVIATGSSAAPLKGFEFDSETVLSARQALELTEVPGDLLIIGGGYIGVEMGTLYAKLGSRVSILQRSERILTGIDADLAALVHAHLTRLGVSIYTNTVPRALERSGGRALVRASSPSGERSFEADKVLVAIGHRPNTAELGLERTRVQLTEQGFIKVNEQRQTTDPNIYAIGDVTGPPLLAHKGFREGKVAAEAIAGLPAAFDNAFIPTAVFSDPEIASVGMSEEEARQKGLAIKVGKFPFHASARALTLNEPDGFVKVVADAKTGLLLGVHVVGPDASDLISEATLALEMGALAEDVAATIHPHPTLSEALMEAAEAALGKAIHIFQERKKAK
ncbi:MAG: dihydrolipoyl dehydrogenase [Candidatus Micrarchaeia archaeon]